MSAIKQLVDDQNQNQSQKIDADFEYEQFLKEKDMEKELFVKNIGPLATLISWSKSGYRTMHPENLVVFNANICVDNKKVWFGDVDVSLDKEKLQDISQMINKPVHVLYEMDGRFDNEENPLIENAIVTFYPDRSIILIENLQTRYTL